LANLQQGSRGIAALLGSGGARHFVFDVLVLPVLPFAMLVFVERGDYQYADDQTEQGEPGIEFSQ